ncbi:DUF4097 family beta strand repeat-containing protein [Mycolicibacterium vinylchloridicum]|uniref:DUF4097 family beta strand repeat-containing protein n=1 Tax=Mycolicibacterium vinylchloridicum TaxID=2736928 RepID=UPI0015CDAB6F|nr:DUF4097 family beta strand repeat-containing protein [Mycolicibacterium vinylchloridicum]
MTTFASPPPTITTTGSSAPPPLTPQGRSAVRVLLVIAATVLTVGSLVALVAIALGINSVRVSTDSKVLPEEMTSLSIDAVDSTVRVTTDPSAESPRVALRMLNSTRGGRQQLQVTSQPGGTRIEVTPASPAFMDWGRTGEVTVTLPPALAEGLTVNVRQDDGTLAIDAELDRLVARTVDGDIVLNGTAHRIDVTTEDGDIVAPRAISVTQTFNAETRDGDVRVSFGPDVPKTIDAVSRDGDVAVGLPDRGPYLVRASGGDRTDVRVPETTDPGAAASEVMVRSDSGNVVVGADPRR